MKTLNPTDMTTEIRGFLVELLHDAGQTDLGPELENILVEDLYSRLIDRLTLTAMQHLSPEKQDELANMGEKKNMGAKLEEFLKKNIGNYDQIFAQALADFRDVYIRATKTE